MELTTFINRDMFKNLAGCILIVEACTESAKLLIGSGYDHYMGLWIAFACSIIVAFIRFVFEGETTKEGIILAIINTIPIFLGSIGAYQIGVKPVAKLLGG